MPVTITDGKSLTLTGTAVVAANHGFDAAANTYTGLGAIDGDDDHHGILIVTTPTNFTQAIGGTKTLNAVTFNNGNAGGESSAGAI